MRVQSSEEETPQALQPRMCEHGCHQPLAEAPATVLFQDENVCQPCERSAIRHHPCKSNLPPGLINPETKGMFD